MGCQKLIYKPELSIYYSKKQSGRNGMYIYKYRYSFNGEEGESDLYGEGMAYDLGERFYDTRLGKMLSLDPLMQKYPFWSPYSYAGNNPIKIIDLKGMGPTDGVEDEDGVGMMDDGKANNNISGDENSSGEQQSESSMEGSIHSNTPDRYYEYSKTFNYYRYAQLPLDVEPGKYGAYETSIYKTSFTVSVEKVFTRDPLTLAETGSSWYVNVSVASQVMPLPRGGDMVVTGGATLNVNGKDLASSSFKPYEATISPPCSQNVGTTRIKLPDSGTVQLEVKINFKVVGDAGVAIPTFMGTIGFLPINISEQLKIPTLY